MERVPIGILQVVLLDELPDRRVVNEVAGAPENALEEVARPRLALKRELFRARRRLDP